jgi:thioredoxin 1
METKNFNELVHSSQPILIDFSAQWCGPCKAMKPVLEKLKARLGEQIKIIKIDVDDNPEIATQLEIRSVPTLMIYQNGERKWRKIGVSSVSEMESIISQLSQN